MALKLRSIKFPALAAGLYLHGKAPITPEPDTRALLWLADQTSGGIVEIGCHHGDTTREFALRFADRRITGIDCTEKRKAWKPEGETGHKAKALPNVTILDLDTNGIAPNDYTLWDCDFIYIDADHTYTGVRADSLPAICYMRKRSGIIAWHDYKLDCPGVKDFLEEMDLPIQHIEGTMLAFCHF